MNESIADCAAILCLLFTVKSIDTVSLIGALFFVALQNILNFKVTYILSMTRWESFPISEQEQAYLASTTTTTTTDASSLTHNLVRHSLGGFIRQEVSDSGQTICFYRYNSADTAIPYLCELGCCGHGCCTISDVAARSTSFGWAIALLVMVLITIVFAVLALLTVWLMNRHKDRIHKKYLAESTIESPSMSQISGPTSFYPDVQFNHQLGNSFKHY